jgi:hypothetical protein
MVKNARSILGVLCVSALIALPTLQVGNSSAPTQLVAIAQPDAGHDATHAGLDPQLARGGPELDELLGEAAAPVEVRPSRPAAVIASLAPDNGKWVWPTPSKLITSPFGYRSDPFTGGAAFHSGIDLGDPCGTPVGATRPGNVTFAGPAGGYGHRVVVDHGEGIWSSYSHLQQIDVQLGQSVEQSEQIGLVGTTGRSTGCHLHFEIIVNGGFADPMPYLKGQPVADPFTFGNGNIIAAPVVEDDPSPSPSPAPTSTPDFDPCAVSLDANDALESGGLIPIGERRTADGEPCPTPTNSPQPSTPSQTPSPDASDSPAPSDEQSSPESPEPSNQTSPGADPSESTSTPAEPDQTTETPSPTPTPTNTPSAPTSEPMPTSSLTTQWSPPAETTTPTGGPTP